MPVLALRVLAADFSTVIDTLDQPYQIEWAEERLDVGAGQFTIPHDSPVVQANPGILAKGNVVVVRVDGTDRFGWLIERRRRERGDTWDPIDVVGEGVTEILRYAAVYQAGGLPSRLVTDERPFGWMAPDFDDSAWLEGDDLFSLGQQQAPDAGNLAGRPVGWPDPLAEWIWTRAATDVGGGVLQHPPGVVYIRRTLQVGAGDGGRFRLHVAAANSFVAYLDGVEVASGDDYRAMQTRDIELVDGHDHVLAFEVENQTPPAGWTGQNIGGLIMSIIRLDDDDQLVTGGVVYRTFTPAVFGGPGAPQPWRGLDYPDDPPGVTIGYILATLFDEWQDRGGVAAIVRDFDADHDSDGVEWADEIVVGFQVGNDSVASAAERLADLGVTVAVRPDGAGGWLFSAWQDRGVDRGGTPDVGVSTVTVPLDKAHLLDTETDDRLLDVLLVRSKFGWSEVPSPAPDADRREGFVALGLTPTRQAAEEQADVILSDLTRSRQALRWTTNSGQAVAQPYADYGLGDVIVGPDLDPDDIAGDWELGDVRVDMVRGKVDETGEVDWDHETSRGEVDYG